MLSNMAKENNQKPADGSALDFEAQLWASADKMRGYMDLNWKLARMNLAIRGIDANLGLRMRAPFPIPTGLRHSAPGCRVREATPGNVVYYFSQPHRGCVKCLRADGCNPFGVVKFSGRFPRVARPSQHGCWAECRYSVGVNKRRAVSSDESRTLAALPLSGGLRVPATTQVANKKSLQ